MEEVTGLSYRQAAERLGVCEKTVMRLCSRGELTTYRVGRAVRVLSSSLREYLERQGVSA